MVIILTTILIKSEKKNKTRYRNHTQQKSNKIQTKVKQRKNKNHLYINPNTFIFNISYHAIIIYTIATKYLYLIFLYK